MGYAADSLQPIAAMALDEFLVWVNDKAPYKDAKSFIEAAKKGDGLKMGGSQSKDVDQTLTSMISAATGAKFTYIPFKSGGEAAVQLAGGHIDSNVNNPSENIGQWKASMVRPLCIFSTERMAAGPKVTKDMGWSDIPTCKESGIPISDLPDAADHLAARRRAGRRRRVLRRRAGEGPRDAGMEGVHRAHVANRPLPDRRRA